MMKRFQWLGLLGCLCTASCGPPEPINIRQEFGKGMMQLGVVPFYPLREDPRIGQLFLVDEPPTTTSLNAPSWVPSNVVVSNAAVPFMERFRSDAVASRNRFPCSSDKLSSQLVLGGLSASYYQQPDCPSSGGSGGGASSGGTAGTGGVSIVINNGRAQPAAPAQPATPALPKSAPTKPETLAPMELAGFPSYNLASIENMSLGGSLPTAFASFLAAVGFSHSTSLTVQAEGIEVATLPSEQFALAISQACSTGDNAFGDPTLGNAALAFARHEMRMNHMTLKKFMPGGAAISDEPNLALYMLRSVYYLRGIRYIFNDTRAAAAMFEASANAKIPTAQTPPSLPSISMNVVTPPAAGTKSDGVTPQMAALQSQIDALRTAISSNTNIQVGATYGRATARGIEFVDLFQRPLAFGYVPFRRPFDRVAGLAKFCNVAQGD